MIRTSIDKAFFLLIWLARLGVFGLVIAAAISLDTATTEQYRTEVRQEWQAQVDQIDLNLQAEILQNVQTVWGLAANVAVEPNIDETRFNQLASVIFGLAPALKNIGVAPNLVIRYVYPLQGNQGAIGLDLTRQSLLPEQVRTLKETGRALFNGPIDLVQGGKGLASRIPIFTETSNEFWGVVSVILDLNKLYARVKFRDIRRNLRFVLSASNDINDTQAIFYGSRSTEWTDPVSSTLRMPGTSWTVFAEPVGSWPEAPENPVVFRSILALLAGGIIGAVFWLTHLMLKDREMQVRFWGLFEFAPIGVGLFNAGSGRLIRANPEFRARFGKHGASLSFFEYSFSTDGTPNAEPLGLRQTLRHTRRIDSLKAYYPTAEDTVAPVRLRGLELQNTGSDPVIWLMAEDISEQDKVERMKSEFISTVSHELRTPLTSISGSLALLANNATGKLPDSMSKMVGIAHRNSLQLTYLINDLLDIDKLVAGKMRFEIERVQVGDLVAECLANIGQFASERKVRLDLAPLQKVEVMADPQRLNQALNNLLSNAIKFSNAGATVHVYSEVHGGNIRICIRDEGEGVPPDFRQRIFEKFSQADGTSSRQKGGTGLGLAITRELMKQMGGSVDYASTVGRGATFWLELPIIKPT